MKLLSLASLVAAVVAVSAASLALAAPKPLFDGKTFAGWEGETQKTWRIEDGAIVGGSLEIKVPHNEFLATERSYGDFELRLKFKLLGSEGFINAGVQIRSQRIPDHFEMIGYQADIGDKYWGALYDESRRKKVLAAPEPAVAEKAVKRGEWNDYRIRAEGRRVRIWLNDTLTVDYTESDETIVQQGRIALQIHGNGKAKVLYKDIVIEELAATKP